MTKEMVEKPFYWEEELPIFGGGRTFDDWKAESYERVTKRLEEDLTNKRIRMEEAFNKVLEVIPEIQNLHLGEYKVNHTSSCYSGGSFGQACRISEHKTYVYHASDEGQQIYYARFSDKDYPSMGVKQGFTVSEHIDPASYDGSIFGHIKKKHWKEVEITDPRFSKIVGVTIIGSLAYLLDIERHEDQVSVLLDALSKQID